MIRQPDVCLCFQGRCWKQFCPARSKKQVDPHIEPEEKPRKRTNKVLTLSESLKDLENDK